jgi:hypothetical protein
MAERKHFDMDQLSKTTISTEMRQAQALEYIAHYLELIEGHLARAANPGPTSSSIDKIHENLHALVHVVTSLVKKG